MTKALFLFALMIVWAAPANAAMPRPAVPVAQAPCPAYGQGACYMNGTVFVPKGSPRFTLWHEFGHVIDQRFLTDTERAALTTALGLTGSWTTGTGDHGRTSPNEWFADAYATCATQKPRRKSRGMVVTSGTASYGFSMTGQRLARLCAQIRIAVLY